jgi:hypothetical protein
MGEGFPFTFSGFEVAGVNDNGAEGFSVVEEALSPANGLPEGAGAAVFVAEKRLEAVDGVVFTFSGCEAEDVAAPKRGAFCVPLTASGSADFEAAGVKENGDDGFSAIVEALSPANGLPEGVGAAVFAAEKRL